jgi:hypothetical protein
VDYFAQITASPEGGTSSLRDHVVGLPTHGYFVGGLVSPLIIDDVDLITQDDRWNLEMFASYLIETVGAEYLGWWTDSETGKVWVDGTTWHSDLDEAAWTGRGRSEIAIYDVAAQAEIRL